MGAGKEGAGFWKQGHPIESGVTLKPDKTLGKYRRVQSVDLLTLMYHGGTAVNVNILLRGVAIVFFLLSVQLVNNSSIFGHWG